jgi:hypothetical protein
VTKESLADGPARRPRRFFADLLDGDGVARCDICGEGLRMLSTVTDAYCRFEIWACSWCFATILVGLVSREVASARYEPVNRRWERAGDDWSPDGPTHASGLFGATLCGVRLGESPYPWVPEWPDACSVCKDAAAVIDARWPVEKRADTWTQDRSSYNSELPLF